VSSLEFESATRARKWYYVYEKGGISSEGTEKRPDEMIAKAFWA